MNRWIWPASLGSMLLLVACVSCKSKNDEGDETLPPVVTFKTNDAAFLTSGEPGVVITPLLTAGEEVPRRGTTTAQTYRMVGIPDGLGAGVSGGVVSLYVNHELGNAVSSIPQPGSTGMTGAFVSLYHLSTGASPGIIDGGLAFTQVRTWGGAAFVDDTANWAGAGGTKAFGRFCSGFLADAAVGFDTQVYLTGEEDGAAANYTGNGGSVVAIADGVAYLLPWMGHGAWENAVVAPGTGASTVVFGFEDAGSLTSQVYMYVGTKNAAGANAIERNGLQGGSLYVLNVTGETGENSYHKGDANLAVTWSGVDAITNNTAALLETATQAAGSFDFVRVEDGACDPANAGILYFSTTGNGAGAGNNFNQLGRLYRLTFAPGNPAAGAATLECLLEGDLGDPVVNPDNLDVNAAGQILMCEDCNGEHRDNFLAGRDGGVWLYDVVTKEVTLIAELNQLAVPAAMRGLAGEWESSGVIDVSAIYGPGRWLIDVQAHSVDSTEASTLQGSASDLGLAEGGQLLLLNLSGWTPPSQRGPWLKAVGGFTNNGTGTAEISAYDSITKRLFVVDPVDSGVEVWDLTNPAAPAFVRLLDVSAQGSPNSVAVNNGLLVVGVEATIKQNDGSLRFYECANGNAFLQAVTVGALPDMVCFTPNGQYALSANEGEPDFYGAGNNDPLGTVSIVPITAWNAAGPTLALGAEVRVDFTAFNVGGARDGEFPSFAQGARIFGPGATRAQDLEPEYIAISPDGTTAMVTLQENNCVAEIVIATGAITAIRGLGFKDHGAAGNELDPSDRDGSTGPSLNASIKLGNWPVRGMYQPDAIASFTIGTTVYYITANEGDARDYGGATPFQEEARVSSLTLDTTAFPTAAALQANGALGRLTVTNQHGDVGADSDFDELYVFGARSFTIWSASGTLVSDSGADLERKHAKFMPGLFNANQAGGTFDTRSDNKGPEPEGVCIGVVGTRTLAFVGCERTSAIAVYDVTVPAAPVFVQLIRTTGDEGPEGILFVPAAQSPLSSGRAMLVVTNEISGTVRLYEVKP